MPWFNPFNSNITLSNSARPPPYPGSTTPAPTYQTSEPRSASAHDPNERVRRWSEALTIASSPDSDFVFEQAHSSLTDIVSISGTSAEGTRPAGPRYIFYRVYAEDGAIPSVNSVYTDDPYLGRISAEIVAPPHIAKNIKLCLSGVEGIGDNTATNLFISVSSPTPMADDHCVPISEYPGPGCLPNKPMALVAMCTGADGRSLEGVPAEADHPQEGTTPLETRYLYYRVYDKCRAIGVKKPASPDKPWIGRISVDSVPPPHTAASIMRCLSKVEDLANLKHPQLYLKCNSGSPIGANEHVSILTDTRPGSTPEDPVAFVESPDPPPAVKRSKSKVPKKMRVINVSPHSKKDSSWLKIKIGEILTTVDDQPRQQQYKWFENAHQTAAYKAINTAGERGFVSPACVEFL
ncbi:hypothetical protein PILCRDRAFT_827049 [Piloderma croceum F 1598]|uniref:Uncharacterized protein n=1 Tax=Piloderma croceum (strain F 1598) TaxID=765440 RepID=A0A0C3BE92_PILCF|nr:hypothetical protein PILCRDRAFT_827049 [Piloderma croceum F 1598]